MALAAWRVCGGEVGVRTLQETVTCNTLAPVPFTDLAGLPYGVL